jgi:hypothetical protein
MENMGKSVCKVGEYDGVNCTKKITLNIKDIPRANDLRAWLESPEYAMIMDYRRFLERIRY